MSTTVFVIAIFCIYYVIKIVSAIDRSIVRLQNAVNSLDERVKKLEAHVFHTWNPYSDED